MNTAHVPQTSQAKYPSLARSFRRGDRAKALKLATSPKDPPRLPDPLRAHRGIEERTESFRVALARKHVARVREERLRHHAALDAWDLQIAHDDGRDDLSTLDGELRYAGPLAIPEALLSELRESATARKWHTGREKGQRERFDRVRACGTRLIIAACKSCGIDAEPIKETCGVRRVCQRCDVSGAMARRARFGRARGRAMIDGARYGLTRLVRKGGRYTEKMLTLTIPHGSLSTSEGEVRELSRDDLHARIVALFRAWPRLLRKINRHFADRWEKHAVYHRSFEWTPGRDGAGHPHFHVYMWCPWIDKALLREWWAEALRAAGWPVKQSDAGLSTIVVDLRMLRGFNVHAVREFLKGGRRSALTLSRIEFRQDAPGLDAFTYAEGWTLSDVEAFCSDDVRARLYCALEARRLTQAARGFFLDDEPPICERCGSSHFRVRFAPVPESETEAATAAPSPQERAPP